MLLRVESEVGELRSVLFCSVLAFLSLRSTRNWCWKALQMKSTPKCCTIPGKCNYLISIREIERERESKNGCGLSWVKHPKRRQLRQISRGKKEPGEERQMQMLKYIYLKWFLVMFEDDFHMLHAACSTAHSHWHACACSRILSGQMIKCVLTNWKFA